MSESVAGVASRQTDLSIVVPCYNAVANLERLVTGIEDQMRNGCELILVDDGSTDGTSSMIERLLRNHVGAGTIIHRRTENRGAASARALGIELATGRFIAFSDSDDELRSNFITTFFDYLARYPDLDLLVPSSSMEWRDSTGAVLHSQHKVNYAQVLDTDGPHLLEFNLAKGMYTAAVWTFVARKSLIESSGAAFTPRKAHEDHLFTLRVMLNARRAIGAPELTYIQRVRLGSLTNSKKDLRYVIDRIEAYQEGRHCLLQNKRDSFAYDWWSLRAIVDMLNANRSLIVRIFATGVGFRLLISLAFILIKRRARPTGPNQAI